MTLLTATTVIRCLRCDRIVGTVAARFPGTVSSATPCYDCENTERLRREATARHQAAKAGRN